MSITHSVSRIAVGWVHSGSQRSAGGYFVPQFSYGTRGYVSRPIVRDRPVEVPYHSGPADSTEPEKDRGPADNHHQCGGVHGPSSYPGWSTDSSW